jgi:hypothetical protein
VKEELIQEGIRRFTSAWFESFGRIWPKARIKLITPKMNTLQWRIQKVVNLFKKMGLPIRLACLKPRQKGSTTFLAALDYTMLRRQSTAAVVIGGQYSQTKELWDMITTYQQNDTLDWGNTGQVNQKSGEWSNGSKLKPETAGDALAGISGTYQCLHCTEVARWSEYGVADAATVLINILKCVPLLPDTAIWLESTAEGASGEFHDRFMRAIPYDAFLSGKIIPSPGDYVAVFAGWFEFEDSAIRLTKDQKVFVEKTLDIEEEYQGERLLIDTYGKVGADGVMRLGDSVQGYDVWEQLAWRRLMIREECKRDKAIFDRDYPHSAKDAFMKSGNLRFNQTGLAVQRKRQGLRVPEYGVLEDTKEKKIAFRKTEKNEATVIMYERAMIGQKYLVSCDPMTGATQTGSEDPDLHGVFVLRAGFFDKQGKWNRPAVVARIIPCRWDIDVLEVVMWRLARMYGPTFGCKIVIEMNMDRGLTELLKQRGADLYQREIFNQREQKYSKAYGYQTNERTRENLVECLAAAIREWDTPSMGIDLFDDHLITECENFVRKTNGRSEANAGHKDDDVIGVALGLLLIDHASTFHVPTNYYSIPPELMGTGFT